MSTTLGTYSVYVFFAISGFLVSRSYALPVQQTVVHAFGGGGTLDNTLIAAPVTLALAILLLDFGRTAVSSQRARRTRSGAGSIARKASIRRLREGSSVPTAGAARAPGFRRSSAR